MRDVVTSDSLQARCNRVESASLRLKGMTVFCDFDGPIIDVSDRYYNTYRLGLTEIQAHYSSQGNALPLHQLSKTQFWQMKQDRVPDAEIALRSGLRHEQINLFLHRVTQIVNQPALLHQDHLQPGVRWALALLRAQGMRLVLVTLRCQTQAVEILQSCGLLHLFSDVWGTPDEAAAYGNSSQHKTKLLTEAIAACSWKQSPGEVAWMVGDTEADVLAGQALGVRTIALTCGIRSHAYLNNLQPTLIRSDLLSATHYLINQATPAYSRT
jgi:phosphoglycolate phosphatase